MLDFKDIQKANEIIKPIIKHTPLEKSKTFSKLTKENVYLKLENLQTTGSFKIRGAYNKIYSLTEKEKKQGVVCASAGNHAQGVAYASTLLNVKSTVFMPIYTPPTKIIATKSYGAKVVLEGKTYDDAYLAAKEYAKKNNMMLIHAFNDEYIIAGQGTIGIEVYEDLKNIDAIVVPIGGGGLISGIALALKKLKPKVKILGVEAEGAQSMKQSLEKKKIIQGL
jgi:threonine dehydratase